MNIVTATLDGSHTPQEGVYLTQYTGRQQWPAEHDVSAWQAPGVRLTLMDGPRTLAVCKLECAPVDADDLAAQFAGDIEPWVKTLRYLVVVGRLRSDLGAVKRLSYEAEEAGWDESEADTVTDRLLPYATDADVAAAQAGDHLRPLGAPLAELVAARLRAQIMKGLRRLLASAPDVTEYPIHPVWRRQEAGFIEGKRMDQVVARNLLAGWAAVQGLRDPLITWAVQGAELSRTEVQQLTGVSRSTTNRLLPA
ncbi:hypothetical protein ACFC7A_19395 [Streptomyces niveus]|uniref:hypothetical protein n=1 Tax=Streptomyces niveus TaxID=193462 RepID=UPI0035DC017B